MVLWIIPTRASRYLRARTLFRPAAFSTLLPPAHQQLYHRSWSYGSASGLIIYRPDQLKVSDHSAHLPPPPYLSRLHQQEQHCGEADLGGGVIIRGTGARCPLVRPMFRKGRRGRGGRKAEKAAHRSQISAEEGCPSSPSSTSPAAPRAEKNRRGGESDALTSYVSKNDGQSSRTWPLRAAGVDCRMESSMSCRPKKVTLNGGVSPGEPERVI